MGIHLKSGPNIKKLFPIENSWNSIRKLMATGMKALRTMGRGRNGVRAKSNKRGLGSVDKINEEGEAAEKVVDELIKAYFVNTPNWRNPNFAYNVGSPVNVASMVMYSIALDRNIYNINDGLAGNSLLAENHVVNIMSNLAGLKTKANGVFTFGGTSTNLYAMKVGTRKADPHSGKRGIPKNMKVFITQDAHFSHAVAADWLGIGTENIITLESNNEGYTDFEKAKDKLVQTLENGDLIGCIMLNGGTTYDQVIDHIEKFVDLRNDLVSNFKLKYKPHIHVDSVIGWAWLTFSDYDFEKNPLGFDEKTIDSLKKQTELIGKIRHADSWGIDFHKGVGGCPIDCSLIIFNEGADLALLSKKYDSILETHQLAEEFSKLSPVDYTLETSRSGGPPLAALASLKTMGLNGIRKHLGTLVQATYVMTDMLETCDDIIVYNNESYGFVTMLRMYPPDLVGKLDLRTELTDASDSTSTRTKAVNDYMHGFFTWDKKTRVDLGEGVEYSYTSKYRAGKSGVDIACIKLYPVSPHFNEKNAIEVIRTIKQQKRAYDTR